MARRGVVVLLGCAWTLAAMAVAAPLSAEPLTAGQPILLAQARVPVLAQTQPPRQQPRLISLDFKDADINNILRILAEFSGLNIVTSDDVKGRVTVKLQNVPWQQALDSVVRAAKLGYVQEGNIIRVDKLENLTKEAEAQFKAEQREVEIQQKRKEADFRVAELERARKRAELREEQETSPLDTAVIQLKYAYVGVRRINTINIMTDLVSTEERKGIDDAITGGVKKEEGKPAGMLSARGQLTIDQRTNTLLVRDIPDNIEKIKEFVFRLDRPIPAIQIEARIVEIAKDDARRLGVIWGGAWTPKSGANSPVVDVRGGAGSTIAGQPGSGPPSTAANFPATSLGAPFNPASLFGLGIGWLASNLALDLSLQALEGQNLARVISSPSLMTLDNEPANIASGQKEPVISITVVGGAQQAAITFQDVTTRLQVLPRIVPEDGQVVLTISVKRETVIARINTASLNAPIIQTRQTVTQARIPDGGTVVLSGLREDSTQNTNEGLPWLKNIPVLGWLFKNDLTDANRKETMVFLTAKIVENPGEAAASPAELPAGPGAPPAPGRSGQAPAPTAPRAAVSSAAPAPEAPRPASPAPGTRLDETTR